MKNDRKKLDPLSPAVHQRVMAGLPLITREEWLELIAWRPEGVEDRWPSVLLPESDGGETPLVRDVPGDAQAERGPFKAGDGQP
jgi:hypothetical protein